jgi:hypothetical protein
MGMNLEKSIVDQQSLAALAAKATGTTASVAWRKGVISGLKRSMGKERCAA